MSNSTPLLQTKRLTICRLQKSDINDLLPILNDSEVMRYIGGSHDRNTAEALLNHWIEDYQEDHFGFMDFWDKKTHRLVGYGGFLHQIIEGKNYIELGLLHR